MHACMRVRGACVYHTGRQHVNHDNTREKETRPEGALEGKQRVYVRARAHVCYTWMCAHHMMQPHIRDFGTAAHVKRAKLFQHAHMLQASIRDKRAAAKIADAQRFQFLHGHDERRRMRESMPTCRFFTYTRIHIHTIPLVRARLTSRVPIYRRASSDMLPRPDTSSAAKCCNSKTCATAESVSLPQPWKLSVAKCFNCTTCAWKAGTFIQQTSVSQQQVYTQRSLYLGVVLVVVFIVFDCVCVRA